MGPFARLRREQRDRFVRAVESNPCRMPPVLQVAIEGPARYCGHALPNLAAPHAYDTLLWPSPTQAQVAEPYWKNLTFLDTEVSLQSPLGK